MTYRKGRLDRVRWLRPELPELLEEGMARENTVATPIALNFVTGTCSCAFSAYALGRESEVAPRRRTGSIETAQVRQAALNLATEAFSCMFSAYVPGRESDVTPRHRTGLIETAQLTFEVPDPAFPNLHLNPIPSPFRHHR